MNATIIIKAASDVLGHATELVVRHGGKVIEKIGPSAVKAFFWNGASAILSLTHLTDSSDEEYELPDIAAELEAIHAKMSEVGKVKITIEIEPTIKIPATPDPQEQGDTTKPITPEPTEAPP